MSDYWPAFALLGVLLASAFVMSLRDWRIGALLIALALPFEGLLPKLGAGGMKVLVAVAVPGLALHLASRPELLARALGNVRSGVSLALLGLIAWSAASLLWALSPADALARTATFAGLFLVLQLFALLDPAFVKRCWLALLASAALTVPVGLAFGALNPFGEHGRFASGGLNPNDYAGLLAVTLFVAMGAAPAPLALRAVLGLTVLAGVVLSGSRTALVALAAAPLLHLLLVPALARRAALYRAAAAYVLVAAGALAVFTADRPQAEALRERAMSLTDYRNADTWAGRLALWRGGLEMIRERPLLGVGAGNFAVAATGVSGMPRRADDGRGQVAHNVFIGVTAELGVPGLLLFGAMWLAALRRARAATPYCDTLLLGLVACLLMSLSLSWEYAKVAYLLMGSALALGGATPAPAADEPAALPAGARA